MDDGRANTSLTPDQIGQIATQRGYVLLERKMTYRGNQALVFDRRDATR